LLTRLSNLCIATLAAFAMTLAHAEASVLRVSDPAGTYALLSERRGDVLLALMPEMTPKRSLLTTLTSPWGRVDLMLNGQPLGPYRAGTLLRITPRLGQNKLLIQSINEPSQQIEVAFGAMRAAGVGTQIVMIEAGRAAPLIARTLPSTTSRRIAEALERRSDGGLQRVFALLRSGGVESTPARSISNWRASGERPMDFGDSNGGGDSDSDSSERPAATNTTSSTGSAETETAEANEALSNGTGVSAETETESSDDRGFDVSADRRSYF
jgi:hypothetical protein